MGKENVEEVKGKKRKPNFMEDEIRILCNGLHDNFTLISAALSQSCTAADKR